MSVTPLSSIDYSTKDYEGFRSEMLAQLKVKMPEYTDFSQTDAGIVILELLAQGLDILSYYQDGIANETLLSTAQLRNSVLKWCPILDYIPKTATPSKIMQVFVLSSAQVKDFTIPKGTVIKTQGSRAEEAIFFETSKDLVIPSGKLGDEISDGKYLYSVEAVQGITVSNESVGSSTGVADQRFTLKYTPVIPSSVRVFVNEGSGFSEWTQVDSFIDSSPNSKHFRVSVNDNDEAAIIFGDGNFGKIPAQFSKGIFCTYRTGGGTSGNVGANKVVVMDTQIANIEKTFNPEVPFEYGIDKESIESIRANAPNSYRTQWGALTYDDFGDITVYEIPEVQEAISTGVGYDVDIYVILKDYPALTEDIKSRILSLFDESGQGRKIVSAGTISVHDPIVESLELTGSLIVMSTYNKETVKAEVINFIQSYFKYGNYHFNTPLSFSSLISKIMNIQGVASFKFTNIEDDIKTPEIGHIYGITSVNIDATGGVVDE